MQEYFHIVNVLRSFFLKKDKNSVENKKKSQAQLNFSQIQYCITFLSELKEHFTGEWPYEMDGSCIRIAVNH